MWPLLLRPEPRFWCSTSEAIGAPLCRSGLTTFTMARRPADVGLTLTRGMSGLRREIDFLAWLQADVRLLPAAAPADETAEALFLALDDRDLDRVHLDLPHELDRSLHFGLGRVRDHAEDDLRVLVRDVRGLFGHDRGQQHRHQALRVVFLHVAGGCAHASISSNCDTAPLVSRTFLKRTRLTG